MKALLTCLLSLGLGVMVSSCGGGGGSSVIIGLAPVDPVPTFSGWSSVETPGTVELSGISTNAAYTTNPEPSPALLFGETVFDTKTEVTIDLNTDGDLERVNIKTPDVTLVWDINLGDLIQYSGERAILQDSEGTFVGAFVPPLHPLADWEYQTYGVWETNRGSAEGFVGGVSMGIPTTDSAIPTTGEVEFFGETLGMYIDADGADYLTYSDLSVKLDFADIADGVAGAMELASSDTYKVTIDSFPGSVGGEVDTSLDFAGFLTYDSLTNTFSGDVTGVGWAGSSTGQFYGPNAEELGGVFSLSKGDGSLHSGSYGAIR